MSVISICRSGSPELYKGKSLDNIAFVNRKNRSEKYELTNRKKEFGLRKTGSRILVHRGETMKMDLNKSVFILA